MGNPGPTWEIRNNNTGKSRFRVKNQAGNHYVHGNRVRCGDTGWLEITGYNKLNNGVNVTRGVNLTVFCKYLLLYREFTPFITLFQLYHDNI